MADDTKQEVDVLLKAVEAIKAAQTWTEKYTASLNKMNAAAGRFGGRAWSKALAVPEEVKSSWKKFEDEQKKFWSGDRKNLEEAQARWKGLRVPDEIKADWRKFRQEQQAFWDEQRQHKIEASLSGRVASALGGQGKGFREVAKDAALGGADRASGGLASAAKGGLWALGFAAAAKVAQVAAENARRSIDSMVVTHEKITAGGLAEKTAQFASAYGKNAIAAVKWNVEAEKLNAATADFATRMGMSVSRSQQFTEFLARSSKMMGVDFSEAAGFATEQMHHFGKSEDDLRLFFGTVQRVSKEGTKALGGMGKEGGRIGAVFAKDLLRSVVEVSKESDIFRHRLETLVQVMGNMAVSSQRLGAGMGQAAKDAKSAFGVLGGFDDTQAFFAGGGARKRALDSSKLKAAQKRIADLELLEKHGKLSADQQKDLAASRMTVAKAESVRRAGIFGGGHALKMEMQEGNPLAFVEAAKKFQTQFGVQGMGLQMLKQRGLEGVDAVRVEGLLLEMAKKGVKAFETLSEVDKNLIIKGTTGASANEAAVGKYAMITKPLASIEALLGKVLSGLVQGLAKITGWLARIFGKGGSSKDAETDAISAMTAEPKKRVERKEKTAAELAEIERKNERALKRFGKTPEEKKRMDEEEAAEKKAAEEAAIRGAKVKERTEKAKKRKPMPWDLPDEDAKPKKGAFLLPIDPNAPGSSRTAAFIPPAGNPASAIEQAAMSAALGGGGGGGGGRRRGGPTTATATGMSLNQDGSVKLKLDVDVPGFVDSVAMADNQIKAGVQGTRVKS